MIRPPPGTDGPRDGTTYLLLPFHVFFTHTLTGRRREAGRRSGQPQDYALSLQPKKWACLPSTCPPSPSPLSCSTSHAVDGRAVLPPQTPLPAWLSVCYEYSLTQWDYAHLPTHRPSVGLGAVSPSEEAFGALSPASLVTSG